MSGDSVCRDFTRGVCTRGTHCRYSHTLPEGVTGAPSRPNKPEFCHDFQNGNCTRHNCRYIHCQRNEEGSYVDQGANDIPVCKDFLQNQCSRNNCKYRHPIDQNNASQFPQFPDNIPYPNSFPPGPINAPGPYEDFNNDGFNGKRRRMDFVPPGMPRGGFPGVGPAVGPVVPPPMVPRNISSMDNRQLQDDNQALRRKVDDLKKQLSHLTATNELLLEQNARLRNDKILPQQGIMIPVVSTPGAPQDINVGVQPPMIISREPNNINGVFNMP